MAVRREYVHIVGVRSVETLQSGAVVSLKPGNKVTLERLWEIAERLGTEPMEANAEAVGMLRANGDGFVLELDGIKRRYPVKATARILPALRELAGQRVKVRGLFTILSAENTTVQLRDVAAWVD